MNVAYDAAAGRIITGHHDDRSSNLWDAAKVAAVAGLAFVDAGLDLYAAAIRLGMADDDAREMIRGGWQAGLETKEAAR